MAEIKPQEKTTKTRKEFKQFTLDKPSDEPRGISSIFSDITTILSRFTSKIRMTRNLEFQGDARIRFNGKTTQYEIYRPAGDNSNLFIDAASDTENEIIQIGGLKRPLEVSINGIDSSTLKADTGTSNSSLVVEPSKAGFFTNTTNTFKVRFPNLSSDPAVCVVGDITVVSGKLKICTATNVFTVVGTQT